MFPFKLVELKGEYPLFYSHGTVDGLCVIVCGAFCVVCALSGNMLPFSGRKTSFCCDISQMLERRVRAWYIAYCMSEMRTSSQPNQSGKLS